MTPEQLALPVRLAAAQRRFFVWRSKRGDKIERIPPALWAAAVGCAEQYGVNRTARSLGLDYACLKRRMHAGSPVGTTASSSAFVEFIAPGASAPECVLEVESRAGAKLRIELRGSAVPDVVDLARRFSREDL
jgi:hypothetical protein